jgi:hypothetical protein
MKVSDSTYIVDKTIDLCGRTSFPLSEYESLIVNESVAMIVFKSLVNSFYFHLTGNTLS